MCNRLIWIDLEMTGLEPEKEFILEIASVVTDDYLRIVAEGPNIAIRQPEEIISSMGEWSRSHHERSGLLEHVRSSSNDCDSAEQRTLEFLSRWCTKGKSPLCGNSVWQDRQFLIRYMPQLEKFFHYRNIDVSSIKELVRRWYPSLPHYTKRGTHRAAIDVKESISELEYYRQKVFLP